VAPTQKPGRSKQNYATPATFIAAVGRRFRISAFYRDLAAEPLTAKADRFYTAEDNALVQPWGRDDGESMWVTGDWNWLNPPYADIEPWVRRAFQESVRCNAQTLVLIPASVGANYWRDWVDGKARVLLLNGRLAFIPEQPKAWYPKDCALLVYGQSVPPGYEVWSWRG
jgi:DNA (cytosine-5)-methyltransferase 1